MVKLFYTTYISEELAHHEILRAKDGQDGINVVISVRGQVFCLCEALTLYPSVSSADNLLETQIRPNQISVLIWNQTI